MFNFVVMHSRSEIPLQKSSSMPPGTSVRPGSAPANTETSGATEGESIAPPATARRRSIPPKGSVAYVHHVDVKLLTRPERRELVSQLFDVYTETCQGLSKECFEHEWFSDDDARVALFYGRNGTLVGQVCARITSVEHARQLHSVFSAGVFFRLGYKGGVRGAQFGIREALRAKVKNPQRPLAYLTRANSPVSYRLLARSIRRVYPNRHESTPDALTDLVRATLIARRTAVGTAPWLTPSTALPRDIDRIRTSKSLADDPDARFYMSLNPNFAEGTSLFVWVPLDVINIVSAVSRLATAQ